MKEYKQNPTFAQHKRNVVLVFVAAFLLLAVASVVAYINFDEVESQLVIHYDVYKGITILENRSIIYNFILIAFGILVVNVFLAAVFLRRQIFITYTAGVIGLLVALFVLIQVLALVQFNL